MRERRHDHDGGAGRTSSRANPSRDTGSKSGGGGLNGALLDLQRRAGNAATSALVVQAKLTVGHDRDPLEHEADRVAQRALSALRGDAVAERDATAGSVGPVLRKKVGADDPLGGLTVDTNVEASIDAARGGGRPVARDVADAVGQAAGADLSGVRVHTDATADSLSRSLQARAFTTGSDIFFQRGAYDPGSSSGQEVLAHELAHVVQQDHGISRRTVHRNLVANAQGTPGNAGVADSEAAVVAEIEELKNNGRLHYAMNYAPDYPELVAIAERHGVGVGKVFSVAYDSYRKTYHPALLGNGFRGKDRKTIESYAKSLRWAAGWADILHLDAKFVVERARAWLAGANRNREVELAIERQNEANNERLAAESRARLAPKVGTPALLEELGWRERQDSIHLLVNQVPNYERLHELAKRFEVSFDEAYQLAHERHPKKVPLLATLFEQLGPDRVEEAVREAEAARGWDELDRTVLGDWARKPGLNPWDNLQLALGAAHGWLESKGRHVAKAGKVAP